MTSLQEKELINHLKDNTHLSTKEIINYVKSCDGLYFSSSGMRDLLYRLGFTYKKPKGVPDKADCELQMVFMILLNQIKSSLGKHDRLYFADASHPQHNSMPSYGWILKGERKELKTNGGRQRVNLHGAIDPDSLHWCGKIKQ